MKTPIVDFVNAYNAKAPLRLHMPGHKGQGALGFEALDITEFDGADVLYDPKGIIAESQANAASLFGAGKTLYSCEGSSLSIRAMLYMALLANGARSRTVLAARNVHRVFMSAAALLDCEVRWLVGDAQQGVLSCAVTPSLLEQTLATMTTKPCAVYVTSPDYLGNTVDIAGLAAVCRRHDVWLLCDNAHGAYRRFLAQDQHPITLGAHLCCDSAHKTLPVLTGGGYLHIHRDAMTLAPFAERAMALFASTSPSYLILQSLDAANAYLATTYKEELAACVNRVDAAKAALRAGGWQLTGDEELKAALLPKAYGYTGQEVAAWLEAHEIVCEFFDADHVVCMFTPAIDATQTERFVRVLCDLPRRAAIVSAPPLFGVPRRRLSPREALFAPSETVSIESARGRVLACETVSCPPAVPIVTGGEEIDDQALDMFAYYGVSEVDVVTEM